MCFSPLFFLREPLDFFLNENCLKDFLTLKKFSFGKASYGRQMELHILLYANLPTHTKTQVKMKIITIPKPSTPYPRTQGPPTNRHVEKAEARPPGRRPWRPPAPVLPQYGRHVPPPSTPSGLGHRGRLWGYMAWCYTIN